MVNLQKQETEPRITVFRSTLNTLIFATCRMCSLNSSTLLLLWTTLCPICSREPTWKQQSRVSWDKPEMAVFLLPASVTMTAFWRKSRHTPRHISTRRKKVSGCLFRRGSGMMINIILFNTSLTTRTPFKSGSSNAITEPSATMNSHTCSSPMVAARSHGSRPKLPASINQS